MTQEVAIRSAHEAGLADYLDANRDLIRRTYAPSLDNTEFELFLAVCRARNLNPIAGHINAFKVGNQVSFSPSVMGMRVIAHRTGLYAGNDPVVYGGEGKDRGVAHPESATMTVYRIVKGIRCAFTATVFWRERVRGDLAKGGSWATQPKNMLAVAAERAALRMAFAEDFSGLDVTDYEPEVERGTARVVVEDDRRFFLIDRLSAENQEGMHNAAVERRVPGIHPPDPEQAPGTQTWREIHRAIVDAYRKRGMGEPRIRVQGDGRIDPGQMYAALFEIPEVAEDGGDA